MSLRVNPAVIPGCLGFIAGLLCLADIGVLALKYGFGHDYVLGLAPLFDFWSEGTVPAFFSSLLLFISSLLLGILGLTLRYRGRSWSGHWLGLSAVFLFLAFDEMLALHERLIEPVQSALNTSGLLWTAWVIPYGMAVLLLAFIYLKWLLALKKETQVRYCIAAALFFMGAIVLEVPGGAEYELQSFARTVVIDAYTFFEDLFEMAGVITFIWATLSELALEGVHITFEMGIE